MTEQENLVRALRELDEKPPDTAQRSEKKRYSESMSAVVAQVVAAALRDRGTPNLVRALPSPPGVAGASGAERRMAGGIGDKKVDVTWATEESGLIAAFSIKCMLFRDRRSNNFQKNLVNRRGDMLIEAVTLHRRFPYSTLVGLLILDEGANHDSTPRRKTTFENAHERLRLFTGRSDPAGRDEQYERFYVGLVSASPEAAAITFARAGDPRSELSLDDILNEMLPVVAERNDDAYSFDGQSLRARPR